MSWEIIHRPLKLDELVFADRVMDHLRVVADDATMNNIMLIGLPGVGKTTTARILANNYVDKLGTTSLFGGSSIYEPALADYEGSALAKLLNNMASTHLMIGSEKKIFILDEFEKMKKKDQHRFNKILEDHSHRNFVILCVNYIEKLEQTISSRCVAIDCDYEDKDKDEVIEKLLRRCKLILEKENSSLADSKIMEILTDSDGDGEQWKHPRKVMQRLHIEAGKSNLKAL